MDSEENKAVEENLHSSQQTIYCKDNHKLNSINWLSDIPDTGHETDIMEVRFKNTRKGFYRNINNLRLEEGDIVAVEASPGHDIGRVSVTGRLVNFKLKQQKAVPEPEDFRKIYRKAKPADIEKWEEARSLEIPTMLKSRQIASSLNLGMKIGDVEYQGDKTKAIFYYIADERVDFRQLIKVLADEFRVRIEMRQIGARQEAGRIGGIGSCGRELCCSSYLTTFISVTTAYARYQELSLNPQKLAGQCGKLKCCLNYELDCYMDKQNDFPPKNPIETKEGKAWFSKMEIYKGIYWYSFDPDNAVRLTPVPVNRVKEIQKMNREGEKPAKLIDNYNSGLEINTYNDVIGNDSITRFEKKSKKSRRKKKGKRKNNDRK